MKPARTPTFPHPQDMYDLAHRMGYISQFHTRGGQTVIHLSQNNPKGHIEIIWTLSLIPSTTPEDLFSLTAQVHLNGELLCDPTHPRRHRTFRPQTQRERVVLSLAQSAATTNQILTRQDVLWVLRDFTDRLNPFAPERTPYQKPLPLSTQHPSERIKFALGAHQAFQKYTQTYHLHQTWSNHGLKLLFTDKRNPEISIELFPFYDPRHDTDEISIAMRLHHRPTDPNKHLDWAEHHLQQMVGWKCGLSDLGDHLIHRLQMLNPYRSDLSRVKVQHAR